MMMTGVGVCVKGSKNNNKTNQGIIGKFLSVVCFIHITGFLSFYNTSCVMMSPYKDYVSFVSSKVWTICFDTMAVASLALGMRKRSISVMSRPSPSGKPYLNVIKSR